MNEISCPRPTADLRSTASKPATGHTPEVSVIIVNWNAKDYLRQCLTSLFKHCQAVRFEVIVVDSGSFDGSAEMVAREFPSVLFAQSSQNVGFARANNLGVRQSRGRYLLFLNPDTEFTEDSVWILCDCIRSSPDAGAIGCRLLNTDRTLQTSCVQSFPTVINQALDAEFLQRWFPRSSLWGASALHATEQTFGKVEVVSGACIFITRAVFETIGGFTEDYFMYGEDLDLCFKVRRFGYCVYYTGETNVIHHGCGSSRKGKEDFADVMMRDSVYRFMRLNRGVVHAACYRAAMAGAASVRIPLIIALRALGRARKTTLWKWLSILSWSLGLTTPKPLDLLPPHKLDAARSRSPLCAE
jgi:GT2 family glycosyltransferase